MTSFYKENQNAIDNQAEKLLQVMKQIDLRRYDKFLFSMYNTKKIYVSIREFVWTYIQIPFLAEATVDRFMNLLDETDGETDIEIVVTNFCLSYPTHPERFDFECSLGHTLQDLIDSLNEFPTNGEDIHRTKVEYIRFRHPEDTKMTEYGDFQPTLGDLGFTTGTKLHFYPETKEAE